MYVNTHSMLPGLEEKFYREKCTGKCKIILMNGFQMFGTIKDVTDSIIVFIDDADKNEKLIYQHAISTVNPLGQNTTEHPGYGLPKDLPNLTQKVE